MSRDETETDAAPVCEVCGNPCDDTTNISEKSIKIEDYTWICYDPDVETQTAYLHE